MSGIVRLPLDLAPVTDGPSAPPPARAYIRSLGSAASKRTMVLALRVAVRLWVQAPSIDQIDEHAALDLFPWRDVTAEHVEALRALLAGMYSVGHANKVMSAVRQVTRRCLRHENDPTRATRLSAATAVSNDRRKRVSPGKMLSEEQIKTLFLTARLYPYARRERALFILALLLQTGLRRSEAANLHTTHVQRDRVGGPVLVVLGKGNKQRLVPLTPDALKALDRWLSVRGTDPGPLLCRIAPAGGVPIPSSSLSSGSLYGILARLARDAGMVDIDANGMRKLAIRPHDYRHTLISALLDAGVDLSVAGQIVGHSSADTTRLYDHRPERARAEAMAKLSLPTAETTEEKSDDP